MKYWATNNPEIEIIALASSRKIYDRLQADTSLNFLTLDCIEDLEREWLNTPYDPAQLKRYEQELDKDDLSSILIADRMLAHGFINGAQRIDTELSRASFDDEKVRAYLTNMLGYFEDLHTRYKPDFTFIYVIAGAVTFGLSLMMRAKGSEALHLMHSRIGDMSLVDVDKRGMFTPIWDRYHANETGGKDSMKWAKNWLSEYREEQKLPFYMKFIKEEEKRLYSLSGFIKTTFKALARYAYFDILKAPKSPHTYTGIQGLKDAVLVPRARKKILNAKFYTPAETLEGKEFIYFPLHVNPEASTMWVTPDHTNQLAVVEALAKRKSVCATLVVKEHPYMLGRRPQAFYDTILNMPGVVLVHPRTNSLSLIKNAILTTTISGTVAWEALLEKKPALVIGDSPYLPFKDGISQCQDLSNMGEGIRNAIDFKPLADKKIVQYLSLLHEESFTVPTNLYWNQIDDAEMDKNSEYAHEMAKRILSRYHQLCAKKPKNKTSPKRKKAV